MLLGLSFVSRHQRHRLSFSVKGSQDGHTNSMHEAYWFIRATQLACIVMAADSRQESPSTPFKNVNWPPKSARSTSALVEDRESIIRPHSSMDSPPAAGVSVVNLVSPAHFHPRPFSWMPNPYSGACSVLCNHPLCPEDRANVLEYLLPGSSQNIDELSNEQKLDMLDQTFSRNSLLYRLCSSDFMKNKIIRQLSEDVLKHFFHKPIDDPFLSRRPATKTPSYCTSPSPRHKLCPVTPEGTWGWKDPIEVDVPQRRCKSVVVYKQPSYVPYQEFVQPVFTEVKKVQPKKSLPRGTFGSPDTCTVYDRSTQSTTSVSPSTVTSRSATKAKPKVDKESKSRKKKKKHKSKKSKKTKKIKAKPEVQTQNIRQQVDTDTDISDTDDEVEKLGKVLEGIGELGAIGSVSYGTVMKQTSPRKRPYRTRLSMPGETCLRAEIEDPITLVEADGFLEGIDLDIYRSLSPDSRRALRREKQRQMEKQRLQKQLERQLDEELANSHLTPAKFKELQDFLQSSRQDSPTETLSVQEEPSIPETPRTVESIASHELPPTQQCPLAMTRDACRFEIPMDIRALQTMRPPEYLRQYCIPNSYLKRIFGRVFNKYKGLNGNLPFEMVRQAMSVVLGQDLTKPQLQKLQELSGIRKETPIDLKLFGGCVCLAMRIICQELEQWLEKTSEKDIIESMDFDSLRLHWTQVSIEEDTRRLIEFIHIA